MSRTWKHIGMTALLLTLVLAGQSQADPEKPLPTLADLSQQLKDISSKLTKINERLTDIEGKKVETLAFDRLVDDFKKLAQAVDTLGGQVNNLQTSYKDLADKVKAQDERMRVARSFEPRPAAPPSGTIRLRNLSGIPATVTIDNTAYLLGPYETRLLENRPFGNFTYEVQAEGFGRIQAPVIRSLTPEEPGFVITINR